MESGVNSMIFAQELQRSKDIAAIKYIPCRELYPHITKVYKCILPEHILNSSEKVIEPNVNKNIGNQWWRGNTNDIGVFHDSKCIKCGYGKIFTKYLTSTHSCLSCGAVFTDEDIYKQEQQIGMMKEELI